MIAAYVQRRRGSESLFELTATSDGALGSRNNILVLESRSIAKQRRFLNATQRYLDFGSGLPRSVPIPRIMLHPGYDQIGDVSLLQYSRSVRTVLLDRLALGLPTPLPRQHREEVFPRQLEDFTYAQLESFASTVVRFDLDELLDAALLEMALRDEQPNYRELVWDMNEEEVGRYLPELQRLCIRAERRIAEQAEDYKSRLSVRRAA